MGHQKKRPNLDPVLESCTGPPITFTGQAVTCEQLYKPNKYGSRRSNSKGEASQNCSCMSPLSFLVKLRDRYIKAMNEMAMRGGDFTAVTGYHAWAEFDYTRQHCKSVRDRQLEG